MMALSDVRDYVLAVESNKDEASIIAKSAAQREFLDRPGLSTDWFTDMRGQN